MIMENLHHSQTKPEDKTPEQVRECEAAVKAPREEPYGIMERRGHNVELFAEKRYPDAK